MIAFLRGRVASRVGNQVVLDVGGVGYRVAVPATTLAKLPAAGGEATLHTWLQVREDAFTLFGFWTPEECQVFETLLGVSGVGPKLALAVLSTLGPAGLERAVLLEDVPALATVPGVGKKLAQRLCLELRDKVEGVGGGDGRPAGAGSVPSVPLTTVFQDAYQEAAAALAALGYTGSEQGAALEAARRELGAGAAVEAVVRQALRALEPAKRGRSHG